MAETELEPLIRGARLEGSTLNLTYCRGCHQSARLMRLQLLLLLLLSLLLLLLLCVLTRPSHRAAGWHSNPMQLPALAASASDGGPCGQVNMAAHLKREAFWQATTHRPS